MWCCSFQPRWKLHRICFLPFPFNCNSPDTMVSMGELGKGVLLSMGRAPEHSICDDWHLWFTKLETACALKNRWWKHGFDLECWWNVNVQISSILNLANLSHECQSSTRITVSERKSQLLAFANFSYSGKFPYMFLYLLVPPLLKDNINMLLELLVDELLILGDGIRIYDSYKKQYRTLFVYLLRTVCDLPARRSVRSKKHLISPLIIM